MPEMEIIFTIGIRRNLAGQHWQIVNHYTGEEILADNWEHLLKELSASARKERRDA